MASLLMEQQEKLRRVVDDRRFRAQGLLSDLHADPSASPSSSAAAAAAAAEPVRVHIEPVEHSDLPSLLGCDNVAVSKFLTVLSHDCLQISRLSQLKIIAPLCKDIETDLRLHVHSTRLKGSVFVNPTRVIKTVLYGNRCFFWC